jgi:hypothetical protein
MTKKTPSTSGGGKPAPTPGKGSVTGSFNGGKAEVTRSHGNQPPPPPPRKK